MKRLWLLFNIFLFCMMAGGWVLGADSVVNAALFAFILMSTPLMGLVAWPLFMYETFAGVEMVLAVLGAITGYVQWFVLVPRLAGFVSRRFSAHDRTINISTTIERPSQLEAAPADAEASRWMHTREVSPLEHVIADTPDQR